MEGRRERKKIKETRGRSHVRGRKKGCMQEKENTKKGNKMCVKVDIMYLCQRIFEKTDGDWEKKEMFG